MSTKMIKLEMAQQITEDNNLPTFKGDTMDTLQRHITKAIEEMGIRPSGRRKTGKAGQPPFEYTFNNFLKIREHNEVLAYINNQQNGTKSKINSVGQKIKKEVDEAHAREIRQIQQDYASDKNSIGYDTFFRHKQNLILEGIFETICGGKFNNEQLWSDVEKCSYLKNYLDVSIEEAWAETNLQDWKNYLIPFENKNTDK